MFKIYSISKVFKTLLVLFLIQITFASPILANKLKEGKKAYSQKQFKKAVKLFSEYAKTNPSQGEPYMYMGYIYESMKQYDKSVSYFRKAVDLNLSKKQKKTCIIKILIFYNYHGAWDYVVHYANKYLKMESNKEVQKMKDKAIAHKGSDSGKIASANINTSSSSTATTQKKESKKTTSKSIEPSKKSKTSTSTASKKPSKTSDKKITSESVPEQNVEANLWEEALSSIQKDDYISADKLLKKLLILAPKDKNYNYKAGIVKLRIGEFDKALELLEESRKLADKSDKTLLYYIHLNEGQLYQKISKLTEAEEHYVKAYNYNNSIPPLLGLTKLKFDSTKFNEVLEFTDNIIKLDPKNLEGLQYRGVSRVKLGNRKEGFQDLLKFSKLLREKHPDLKEVASEYQDGILYLGSYYSNRSKYKLAQKYLKMVQTSKMDSNTYSFSLGKTYFYTGKYDLAMIQLERTKNVPAAQYLIGKIFAIQKNIPKSKEYLAKAAEGKEIYWIKARFDKNYKDLMEYQDFSNFVINKGKIVPEKAAVINKPAVEEIKTEITPPQKEESKKEENSLNNQEISKP